MIAKNLQHKLKEFYNDCDLYKNNLENLDDHWYEGCLKLFYEHFPEKNVRILDLGCGIGRTTRFLGNEFKKVIGLDYSLTFCRHSKERGRDGKGISFVNADATFLPFKDECLQGIFSYATIEHLYDVKRALGEMDRVLGRNGVILIHMPNLLTPLRPLKAIFSREKLKYPKPESGENPVRSLYLVFRNIFLTLRKSISRKANFMYREPNLEIIEGDYDAVYLSSPLDIKKYYGGKNYEIKDLTYLYRPYRGKNKINKGLKWLMYKIGILQMVKMTPGTYATLLLRKR